MKNKKFLIVGGDSLLGRNLALALRTDNNVTVTTRHKDRQGDGSLFLDLDDAAGVKKLSVDYDIVFLCASITSTEFCRLNPETSRALNVDALVEITRKFTEASKRVVFFSSNYVFNGKVKFPLPSTPRCPATEYGRQKADAEKQILELDKNHLIIRLSKVVHPEFSLFVKWIKELKNGHKVTPFSDLYFAPVSLQFAVNTILKITSVGSTGIWHISADRDISYAEAAKYICDKLRISDSLLEPVTVRNAGVLLENIPEFTALDMHVTADRLGIKTPSPFQAIEDVLLN